MMSKELRTSFEAHGKPCTAVIFPDEDQFVAECPETGTVSQGDSIEEALFNIQEATELYLEEFPEKF